MKELVRKKEEIFEALASRDFKKLKRFLGNLDSADVVEILSELPAKEKLIVFRLLPKDLAADVFSELEPDEQQELLELFKDEQIKSILEEMDPDDRVELFDELPAGVVKKLLKLLSPEDREITMELLNYPENSAGRIMNPEFVDLYVDMTVAEALYRIREKGRDLDKETIYTPFVIDRERKLLGVVDLKDLILVNSDVLVSDIMKPDPIFVYTTTDQEEVARIVRDHDLIAIPVVDSEGRLVGVITVDDIVDVIEEETTEDIHHMASMGTFHTSYFHTPLKVLVKNRVPWLSLLLLMGSITANVVARYESLLSTMPIIAAFFTTMSGTGGNVGSQSAAIIIRAMALGDIGPKDWFKVLWKELKTAIVISIPLAAILLGRAFLISSNVKLNFAISFSLIIITIYANMLGAMLPLIAGLFKIDPAVMAGPLLATIVDVTGITMYFATIQFFLNI